MEINCKPLVCHCYLIESLHRVLWLSVNLNLVKVNIGVEGSYYAANLRMVYFSEELAEEHKALPCRNEPLVEIDVTTLCILKG